MSLEELYAREGKNPWSIRSWLINEGFKENLIDIALAEHGRFIATGNKYGYKDGVSLLAQSIRKQVKSLTLRDQSEITMLEKLHFRPNNIRIMANEKPRGFFHRLKKCL